MIRKLILFTFLIASIFFPQNILGQQYNFRNFSLEDGLPQSEVNAFLQDSRHYIWLGTNGGGLSRFNGKKFESFTTQNGLSNDVILDLLEDTHGNIWIATLEGIDKYDGNKIENVYANVRNSGELRDLFMDNDGNLWTTHASSRTELNVYRIHNGKLTPIEAIFPDTLNTSIKYVFQTQDKNLHFFTKDRLYTFKDDRIVASDFLPITDLNIEKDLCPRLVDHRGTIWLTNYTFNGTTELYVFKNGKYLPFQLPKAFSKTGAVSLFEDSKHNIWIAHTSAGLLKYNGKEQKHFTYKNGLPNYNILDIKEDHEGNIWFPCRGSGLIKYSGDQFRAFNMSSGLPDEIIFSIYQDQDSTYWFSTSKGTVVSYDGNKLKFINDPNLRTVRKILGLPDGTILFASYSGLWKYTPKEFTQVNSQFGLKEEAVISDMILYQNTLYFSCIRGNFSSYNLETGEKKSVEFKTLSNKQLRSVFIDKDENFWIGTMMDGAIVMNRQEFNTEKEPSYTMIDEEFGLKNNHVMQTTQDYHGNIWMATYGRGIALFDGKKAKMITKTEGLTSNNVYSIITDDQGDIWVGTQNGVDKIEISKDGKIKNIRNYGLYEGFTGIENNGKATYKDRQGNLWFGTIRGAIQYNFSAFSKNTTAPKVHITDLKLYYKGVDWNNKKYINKHEGLSRWTQLPLALELPYTDNHLSFEFEALSYKVPEKVKYQWKLEGLDEEWSPVTSKTEAVYSNLPAGEYTFKIKACNNDGVWSQDPAVYYFSIQAPWWDTLWFKGITVFLLVSIAFFIVKVRVNNIKAKKKELEWLVEEKTKEIVHQKDEVLKKSDALRQAYENLELLTEMGKDITSNLSVEKIIATIYENLNNLMDASVFWIGIYDKNKKSLIFKGAIENGKKLSSFQFDLNQDARLAVRCFNLQEEILITDYQNEHKKYVADHLPPIAGGVTASVIYLPLLRNGKCYGVISVQSNNKEAYSSYHLNILRNIATYAQIALDNAKAYEKIEGNNKEIESKNKELMMLDQEKNHLIGIVAHDLRNPLTSAMTMANLLNSEVDELNEDQAEYTKHMLRAIQRMDTMITRILDVKMVESNSVSLELEHLNLKNLVLTVCRQFEQQIKSKHLNLNLELQDAFKEVDRSYCMQIIENLVSNAIKFSPLNSQIWVRLTASEERIRLEVKDEGPGLTYDDHKKLFGKFQKLSAHPTAGEQSTGLGLSIVKKYVEVMNGKVWCESEKGKGACFIVEFPKKEPDRNTAL